MRLTPEDRENLEDIKERLDNERDSDEDDAEVTPWIATLDRILSEGYDPS